LAFFNDVEERLTEVSSQEKKREEEALRTFQLPTVALEDYPVITVDYSGWPHQSLLAYRCIALHIP
jgi:hypothetical protein